MVLIFVSLDSLYEQKDIGVYFHTGDKESDLSIDVSKDDDISVVEELKKNIKYSFGNTNDDNC